ncbi:PREDICTED: zinc finger A20 and AN1 domain-containing stress-associated protein 4-like [Tarenaya hassleriana]|uniref:zinc finger A20 and AN1 domain-containing stress-associated protein 4-like n=1 Tax=Tarenaya hassleriana TaxID=28532 RepID=UPI00053C4AE6|nr:PREDICTED: zinc finger A20 and AN1 domain-containing stress-associated protein 4-like [Tarenaya hassleriana]
MAEEHRCQTPEGHRLCVNNCGFLGSSTTMNLCSNCYRDLCLKQQQQAVKSTVETSLPHPSSAASSPPPSAIESISSLTISPIPEKSASSSAAAAAGLEIATIEVDLAPPTEVKTVKSPAEQPSSQPSRCSVCRKRVGLTGFKCRCGTTFCGTHRYPEVHGCSFDFKSIGREAIAKANPLVKAAKLNKI